MSPRPVLVHAALLSVSLLFGINYVVTKMLLATVSPAMWVLLRIVAAAAVILPIARLLARRERPPRATLAWLGFAALLGIVANQILFTEGMARTTPQHSAVVNALIPTWTLLIATLVGQERLSATRVLAILLALGGVQYLLGVDRWWFGTGAADAGATLLGDLLTMGNGISFAAHLVLMRRVAKQLDPWFTTATMFAFAAPMMIAWCAPQCTAADFCAAGDVWALGLYSVLGATVITYLLNTWALRHAASTQVALYINVQPLVAAATEVACGGPAPTHRFYVALGLVGFGLWLQGRRR